MVSSKFRGFDPSGLLHCELCSMLHERVYKQCYRCREWQTAPLYGVEARIIKEQVEPLQSKIAELRAALQELCDFLERMEHGNTLTGETIQDHRREARALLAEEASRDQEG